MFRESDQFNQDLSTWDLSKVTNFTEMFFNTNLFTGTGLGTWKIGGSNTDPIDMTSMFSGAVVFNEPLNIWETANGSTMQYVTSLRSMFRNAALFNQPLDDWDVGRVTNFNGMFYTDTGYATSFNNGDAANASWDIPSETGIGMRDWNIGANLSGTDTIDMSAMFGTTRINEQNDHFNQDLSNWDVSRVTTFASMFQYCTVFTGDGAEELLPANNGTTPPNETLTSGLSNWKIGDANNNPIIMTSMFNRARAFNEPLNSWETEPGSTMAYVTLTNAMFLDARSFNQPLDDWNVGRVTNFNQMFYAAAIFNNGDAADAGINEATGIGTGMRDWNIGENLAPTTPINGMFRMFRQANEFNQDLSNWDVTRVINFQEMFWNISDFTGNGGVELASGTETLTSGLSNWKIGGANTNAINMQNMFGASRAFQEPLANWETATGSTMGYVTNMREMFNNADAFNHPLGVWDVGRVTNFIYMFANNDGFTDDNPSIVNWNIGQNTGTTGINMQGMFQANTAFNNPLEDWERAANTPDKDPRPSTMAYVVSLRDMFRNGAIFNNAINTWNVGRVGDFHAMFFQNPNFNQPVNNWNIGENRGNGINMQYTFHGATAFNQPVNEWDVSKVQHFLNTFTNTTSFDQSLAAWTPITGTDFRNMLNNSGLSVANYDATLTSWAQQDLIDNQALGAVNLEFCSAEPFRASLVSDQGWTISGDILGCAPGNVSGAGKLLYWVTAGAVPANDGDAIDEWRDISGDGRVFTQTTPVNQPTLLKNTTDMVNFNPLMKFDGTDDYMQGFDFNAQDLSFPNTPRVNLTIVGRTASSELSVTTNPAPPENPVTYTFTANNSALGNNFNGANAPGSWRPENLPSENNNTTEYLQLDLGEVVPLSTIRTRGERANAQGNNYVTSYTVQISTDGTIFTPIDGVFTANTNRTDVVLNAFSANTPAQYVRIYPQTWNGYPALCVGLGTKGYNQASTFVLALEDARQDHVIQSANHLDANNNFDISLANGSGNTTAKYSFSGGNEVDLSATAPPTSNDAILINYSVSGSGEAKLYRNGVELATDATVPRYQLMGTTYLGGLPTGNYFNGTIAEANLFADVLSQSERERINTYFAIKYNIPLAHNMVYEDEVTSTVETVWDKTANAAYDNDVFGLAKDDNQGLNQSVSSSRIPDDKVLTVATVSDFTNLNSDPGRLSLTGSSAFVVIGNDDEDTSFSINGAPSKFKIMNRKWFAQVTGNDQPLFFEFNVGLATFDIPDTEQTPDYYLVIDADTDGDLSDEQPILMTNTSGDLWSTPNAVTVSDGQLFTVAYAFTVFPGGVGTNLALWLKGNAGTIGDAAMTVWEDQSVNNNNFSLKPSTNNPDATIRTTNFNPAVYFDGGSGMYLLNNNLGLSGNTNMSYFFVGSFDADTGSGQTILEMFNEEGASSSSRQFAFTPNDYNVVRRGSLDDGSVNVAAPNASLAGISSIGSYIRTGTTGIFGYNGLSGTAAPDTHFPTTFDEVVIGRRHSALTSEQFTGDIEEIVAYNTDIAPFEKLRIESYLALKYGITLDQSTATDYVASDWDGTAGTLMWDSAADTNYNNDIFGIGLDEAAGFNQKISKSINANTVMTVSMDSDDFTKTNGAVANGHSNNLQFMSFASNGLATDDQVTELDAANYRLGITREWQVYKTANFTDAVNLKFEGFGGYDLIQSTDDDFSTAGDQTVLGTLDANGELTNVTGFVSGSYITLAIYTQGPGGVTNDLALWLKADAGIDETNGQAVDQWNDQSLGNNDVIQSGTTEYSAGNALNFNPAVNTGAFGNANNGQFNVSDFSDAFSNQMSWYMVFHPQNDTYYSVVGSAIPTTHHDRWPNDGTSYIAITGGGNPRFNSVTALSATEPQLVRYNHKVNNQLDYGVNGTDETNTSTVAFSNTLLSQLTVGSTTFVNGSGVSRLDGQIAEIIVFADEQTSGNNRQKIESYLALKYGITLDASSGDYLNTAGNSVYDLSTYSNDVFGIANDAVQALNQDISKSVNTGAIVTISTDTNFTGNSGTHTALNDGQYLVMGNNGASGAIPSSQNTTDLNTNLYFNRVARQWKATNTGSVGQVNLQFDGYDANWVLLTRTTDDDFSATTGTLETALAADGTVAVTLPGISYFTLAQKPIAIEFETATASDVEATGGNLPNLLIEGTLTADATIDILVNATGTATAGTDYILGDASGDDAVTLSTIIPAGTYTASNPLPLVTALIDDIPLNVRYANLSNPPANFEQETFVPAITGDYIVRHSAETVNNGTGWINIGTTASGGAGSSDVYDGVNGGERIDAANLLRTRTISLTAGTTYYLTTGAGGNSNLDGVNVRITHPIEFSITDDTIVEADEIISLSLSNPNNGLKLENITGAALIDTHEYTITDDDTATVTIAADADAPETTASRAFTLTMDTTAATDVEVTYVLSGTAQNPADYADNTTVEGTVSFAAGSTTATIDLAVVDDTLVELQETVIATLTAATNNSSVTASTTPVTANITDDDAAAVTLSIGNPVDATEGTSDISYTVSLDDGRANGTGADITGTLTLTGTATNGTDYTDVVSFAIADGESSVTITVAVTDDDEVEVVETVIATISNPSIGSISTAEATANITDDDAAALTLSIGNPVDATEGTSDISYTISLDANKTNGTGADINGTLALTGTATNGTDYTDVVSFAIADGASSTTITVTVADDDEVEQTETVIATISNPSIGIISTEEATANITDDDAAALTLSIGNPVDATEGTSDISYTVSLDANKTNGTGADITGTLALTGTATNGTDYTDVVSFAIADGENSTIITVDVVNDDEVEVVETVIATISNPSTGSIGTAEATATITDDDAAALTLSIGNPVDATEGTSDISYTVSLDANKTNGTGADITGTLALTGTATNGTDYTDVVSFAIADGASSTTITVTVTDDDEVEDTETVIATISNPSTGSIGTAEATANITDDDAAALTLSIGNPLDATEGTSDISYTVSLDANKTNGTGADISGTLALTGTATNGTDYTDVVSFAIADGASSTTITVTVADDLNIENTETVEATISNISTGSIGTAVAVANINDDDSNNVVVSITNPVDAFEGTSDVSFDIGLEGMINNTGAAITGALTLTGTATNGVDYTDVTNFSIPDGEGSITLSVVVIDDQDIEPNETVEATIANPSLGSIGTATATATITDDEAEVDTDGDGITDGEEVANGTSPTDPCDPEQAAGFMDYDATNEIWAAADCDGDGVTNGEEHTNGTDPYEAGVDTDGDGIPDDVEVNNGTDEIDPCSPAQVAGYTGYDATNELWAAADCDGDGVTNGEENANGDDPYNFDTDNIQPLSDLVDPRINDGAFLIDGIDNFPNNTVKIINRWGSVVFEITGYNNDDRVFRGISTNSLTVKGEEQLPVGMYFYNIQYVDDNENVVNKNGYIYINR
jgi:surface protein